MVELTKTYRFKHLMLICVYQFGLKHV